MTLEPYQAAAAELHIAARTAFLADIERTLAELRIVGETLVLSVGEVTREEAYRAWCFEMSAVLRDVAGRGAPRPEAAVC